MVTLEQVKLLESKVGKAIDYVRRLSGENATLRAKLEGYRVRIDELEVLVRAFKDDQGKIEAGIISALERLNQFEDAVEQSLTGTAGIEADEETTVGEDPIPEPIAEDAPESAPEGAPEGASEGGPEEAEPETEIASENAESTADESVDEKQERSTELDIF